MDSSLQSSHEDVTQLLQPMKICIAPTFSLANSQSLMENNNSAIDVENITEMSERDKLIQNLQKNIMTNIVIPFYEKDLQDTFSWRGRWLRFSRAFLWFANVVILCSSVMNALQIYQPNEPIYSMFAVIGNAITLLLLNFSGDMKKESRNLTTDINNLLRSAGINALYIPQATETRQTNNNTSQIKTANNNGVAGNWNSINRQSNNNNH